MHPEAGIREEELTDHAHLATTSLEDRINALFASGKPERTQESLSLLQEFRGALNRGQIRVAEPRGEQWLVNAWVKKGILLHLALGVLQDVTNGGAGSNFELDTFPSRRFGADEQVRIPPGGSSIRDGVHLGRGVACMPPVFVNIGVFVDDESVLDSHVSVGACTQIGKRVHIGPSTQIGGLLNPSDRIPTIIEDDVMIGGNCGLYDGVCVGKGAVLAAGLVLSGHSRVYDPGKKKLYVQTPTQPLSIPPMAIVVPGSRPVTSGSGAAGGFMVDIGLVAGYRDDPKTSEDLLANLLG